MDVCKIAPSNYQYTAIDDCTRYKVLRLYSRRTADSTLDFLEAVIEEMPFAFRRIQTDRGGEFFATKFQVDRAVALTRIGDELSKTKLQSKVKDTRYVQ